MNNTLYIVKAKREYNYIYLASLHLNIEVVKPLDFRHSFSFDKTIAIRFYNKHHAEAVALLVNGEIGEEPKS